MRLRLSDPKAGMMTSTQPRRNKRVVADTEKDDRYWEKRAKNNIAARKSREHRRQMESVIRKRAVFLEEETALLKKEVAILRERLGLPVNVSVLTEADREECVKELWEEGKGSNACHFLTPEGSQHSTDSDSFEQTTLRQSPQPTPSAKTLLTPNVFPDREQSYLSISSKPNQYCYILTNSSPADTSLPCRDDEPFDLSPRSQDSNSGISDLKDYGENSGHTFKRRLHDDDVNETSVPEDLTIKRRHMSGNTNMTLSSDVTLKSQVTVTSTSNNLFKDARKSALKQPSTIDLIGERLSTGVQAKLNQLSQQIFQMQQTLDHA